MSDTMSATRDTDRDDVYVLRENWREAVYV